MLSIPASRPNVYTGNPLDRASDLRDDAGVMEALLARDDALFVPVWRGRSLLRGVGENRPETVMLRNGAAGALRAAGGAWCFLGLLGPEAKDVAGDRLGATPVYALDCSDAEDPLPLLPEGAGEFTDIRPLASLLPAGEASILAHARGMMHWRTRHRFCGVCGATCEPRSAGNVVVCTNCGTSHFPRTDPAVIMLVIHGDRCLLGNSTRFPDNTMYSTLAGFVEPGESLEEAVRREVLEESGIRVGRAFYHSSQPWPFPASIMLGFHAEALTEEIAIDPSEIRDARWFSRDDLRRPEALGIRLPRADSIARRLIEDWLESP
ncbi:NAD(+) diphosphatase [Roseomonas elaeocarpi]|uniref:NAD(+) diphosphatase n=1 Tax=Roseomonas elaeocarpi TaxID=907779 RepID=A0ABV6JYD1_9PROT